MNIKKFYGQSEKTIYNQVFIALIVFCLYVLAQIDSKNERKILQISRYLKATLWKPAHLDSENERESRTLIHKVVVASVQL